MAAPRWICSTCGRRHTGLPAAIAFPTPLLLEQVPREHRDERVLSVVENEAVVITDAAGLGHFFRRGLVEMPTSSENGVFAWNIWAELTRPDFELAVRDRFDQARAGKPPSIGTIACRIPGYLDTVGLRVSIKEHLPGSRPRFTVLDDHLLRNEQAGGITSHRHSELIRLALGK